MTGLLLVSALLAAPDAGVASPSTTRPAVRADAGTPSRAADGGTSRATGDAGSTRESGARATSVNSAPEPSTRIAVQEPAAPDAGTSSRKKKARADRTDGQPDPYMEALLEQSRAQTEALQQMAAQQQASEESRQAEQAARTQRYAQIDGARGSIDGTVYSLQTSGNWDAASLQSTRLSLQQTAAAASAAGAPVEASRASQAASLIEAAEAALAQKNAQQAQYYLLQANQLLGAAQGVRY